MAAKKTDDSTVAEPTVAADTLKVTAEPKAPVAPEITFTETHVSRRTETLARLGQENPDFVYSFDKEGITKAELVNGRELVYDTDLNGNKVPLKVGNDVVVRTPKPIYDGLRTRAEQRSFARSPFGPQRDGLRQGEKSKDRPTGPASAIVDLQEGDSEFAKYVPKDKRKKR